jgi:hypothetical protein
MTRQRYQGAALIPENEIDLCYDVPNFHHTEAHSLGRDSFARRYGLEDRFERAKEAVWQTETAIIVPQGQTTILIPHG